MPALFAAGDIHGQYDTFLHLLRSRLLVDAQGSWTGADAQLWLTGGLLDCRPQAIPGSLAVLPAELFAELIQLALDLFRGVRLRGGDRWEPIPLILDVLRGRVAALLED